jgi:hypothetical protein
MAQAPAILASGSHVVQARQAGGTRKQTRAIDHHAKSASVSPIDRQGRRSTLLKGIRASAFMEPVVAVRLGAVRANCSVRQE